MKHPYVVGTKIPQVDCDIDPDFDEDEALAMFDENLKAISRRNKACLPPEIHRQLSQCSSLN